MGIKQISVAFLFTALVISCGNKAKDINVSELKTECDVADAYLTILEEMIALREAVDSEEGVDFSKIFTGSEAQEKEYESLEEKSNEINRAVGEDILEDYDLSKVEACPSYETFEALMVKYN